MKERADPEAVALRLQTRLLRRACMRCLSAKRTLQIGDLLLQLSRLRGRSSVLLVAAFRRRDWRLQALRAA